MGQRAEDMLCGWMCSDCGIFFVSEHGYPVLCKSCACDCSKKDRERLGFGVATLKEVGDED